MSRSRRVELSCRECGERLPWREQVCQHCGWDRQAWLDAGRYGVDRST